MRLSLKRRHQLRGGGEESGMVLFWCGVVSVVVYIFLVGVVVVVCWCLVVERVPMIARRRHSRRQQASKLGRAPELRESRNIQLQLHLQLQTRIPSAIRHNTNPQDEHVLRNTRRNGASRRTTPLQLPPPLHPLRPPPPLPSSSRSHERRPPRPNPRRQRNRPALPRRTRSSPPHHPNRLVSLPQVQKLRCDARRD